MLIERLVLRNIRSYVKETIEFPTGPILLSGDIGSGKSTILHAIEFALFGVKARDLPASSLLRHGTNIGSVELTFHVDKKKVTITRSLKRTPTSIRQDSGHIIIDGVREDLMPVELKARIIDILGYPPDAVKRSKDLIYRYTVYTPQEEMKHILFNDDERLNTLLQVFQIDTYKAIRDNIPLARAVLREKRAKLDTRISDIQVLSTDREQLQEKIHSATEYIIKVNEGLSVVSDKKKSMQNQLALTEKELQSLQALQQEAAVLDTEINNNIKHQAYLNKQRADIMSDLDRMKTKLASLDPKPPSDKSPDMIARELAQAQSDLSETEKRQAVLSQRLSGLEKDSDTLIQVRQQVIKLNTQKHALTQELTEIEANLKNYDHLDKDLLTIQEKTRTISSDIATKKALIEQSNKLVQAISNLTICPTCRQDVQLVHKEAIHADEAKKCIKLKSDITGLTDIQEKNQALSKSLQEKLKKKNDSLERKATIIAELKSLDQQILDTKKTISNLEKSCQELIEVQKSLQDITPEMLSRQRKHIDNLMHLQKAYIAYDTQIKEKLLLEKDISRVSLQIEKTDKDLLEIKTALDTKTQQRTSLNESLGQFNEKKKTFDKLKGNLDKLLDKENDLKVRHARTKAILDSATENLEKIDTQLKQTDKLRRESQRCGTLESWLGDFFARLMLNIENLVMRRVYHKFNEQFMQWFSILIEDDTLSARLDTQFTPVITQNGYDTSVTNLSGGERTAVALSYRLALNKVVNDLIANIRTRNLLMLDEPTDGFSAEQLDRVRDILDSLNLRQIIIVSHEPKLEGFVRHVIRVGKSAQTSTILTN